MIEYICEFSDHPNINDKGALREKVVRCRDCKFRCLGECTRIDEGFKDYWFAIEPDGFCAWAKSKEGGE